ncbi:UNVERIFIED_ORG: hypothetical protein M2328_005734 [Rhodococcus erythropolis]
MTKDDVRAVMRRAKAMDNRLPNFSDDRLEAWHAVLEDACWPAEALAAVKAHYAKPNAFQILPGDVVDYCKSQPAWSSADHAREFLRKWCQHPYSGAIGMQAGIEEPLFAIPESVVRDDHKKYLIHRLNAWVSENEQMLIDNILEKKLNPW